MMSFRVYILPTSFHTLSVNVDVPCSQSYLQPGGAGGGMGGGGMSGGGGGGTPPALGYLPLAGAMRTRAHTPLRHAHVTSTTHPHHLQGQYAYCIPSTHFGLKYVASIPSE